jgi:hypothetical protein
MDFVEGFHQISKKLVVLTVVDRFLKYAHFIALGSPVYNCLCGKSFFLIPLLGYMAYYVQLFLTEIQFSPANSERVI